MILFVCAFLCGDLSLHWHSTLPSVMYAYGLCGVALILLFLHRYSIVFSGFAFGFGWAILAAHQMLAWQLPHAMENKLLEIRGVVQTIPAPGLDNIGFEFYVNELKFENSISKPHTKIKLYWRNPNLKIMAHDHLQLLVKLKHIHGSASPGAFNSEQFAFMSHLRATGQVVKDNFNQKLLPYGLRGKLNYWRQQILELIDQLLPATHAKPWLIALMVGERQSIPSADWEILRRTGTNHLIAIAGLHIGMLAVIANAVMRFCWRRIIFLQIITMPTACAVSMLSSAITYSALAGFSLPTQRACLMLCGFLLSKLWRVKFSTWHIFSLVLLIVLILNPFSIYSNSFWLSFGTIALIIFGMQGRLAPQTIWWRWGRVQWVIGCGLIPMSAFIFSEAAFISFFVNCLAIPFLGIAILPVCLLGLLLAYPVPQISLWIFKLADFNLSLLWHFLSWCASIQINATQLSTLRIGEFIALQIAILIFLLPRGVRGRIIASCWYLPLIFKSSSLLPLNTVEINLLDVGQGLSTLIRTANHALLFDTGNQFLQGGDMGAAVILPFLQTNYIQRLDALILSHGDNDHIGGAKSILNWQNNLPIYTSDIRKIKQKLPNALAQTCLAGRHWQWDGVNFEFLYPDQHNLGLNNNSSCVLQIKMGKHAILLTGDIEKRAENFLVNQYGEALKSDLLIAPHHGSKTSALASFVNHVRPAQVWYPIGYLNRYHFPHPQVIATYDRLGAIQFDTVTSGSLQMQLNDQQVLFPVRHYRYAHRKYWQD